MYSVGFYVPGMLLPPPISMLVLSLTQRKLIQPLLHMRGCTTSNWAKAGDILLCVFGLVVMVYTTTLTIKSWATK